MTGRERILSLAAIAMSVVAITMSCAAYISPGAQGPVGATGVQGSPGPTPNRTGIYAIATCTNNTPPAPIEYSVDVFMVNFGDARHFDYKIRYFYGDGATLADEIDYGAFIAPWSVDKMTVHADVLTDTGCAFPHILWEEYTKIVRWS
jgi:hypothetical protein